MMWLRKSLGFASRHRVDAQPVLSLRAFLSYLAVERNAAVSTKSLGLNAIVFWFRHVLGVRQGNCIKKDLTIH